MDTAVVYGDSDVDRDDCLCNGKMMKYAVEKIRNLDVSGKLLFNFCFLISAALFIM